MAKDVSIRIAAIHIIESLPRGDLRTGERLRDDLEPSAAGSSPPITVHFWCERTRANFLERLQHIAEAVRITGQAPIVHIEAHGAPDGLRLACGDVSWADLKAPLTAINIACSLNLLVLLGACDGAGLLEVIQATDRAPVWGLIGPKRVLNAGEIEDAHRAFYRTLFSTKDGGAAWHAMNAALKGADSPFGLFGAEAMFQEVMRSYYREDCSEHGLAERTLRIVNAAKKDDATPERLRRFEANVGEYLRDHEGRFDETKKHFFFVDLCPEHSDRFKVAFDDCFRSGGGSTTEV